MNFDWRFSGGSDSIVVLGEDQNAKRNVSKIVSKWPSSPTKSNPYFQRDILRNLTKFCDLQSLANLSQTCSYLYYFINHSEISPLKAYLLEANKIPEVPNESGIPSNDQETLKLETCSISDENFYQHYFKETLQFNLGAKAARIDDKLLTKARSLFEIKVKRMASFISARVIPLPISISSMQAKGYNITDLIKDSLDNFEGYTDGHGGTKYRPRDAFSFRKCSFKRLSPIQSTEELQAAITADYKQFELKVQNPCSIPKAEVFVTLLKEILQSKQVLIFQDVGHKSSRLSGLRFIVFGNRNVCLFQYEMASNICGGPYSMMSCGMG